jgi:copper(I)-binding protein
MKIRNLVPGTVRTLGALGAGLALLVATVPAWAGVVVHDAWVRGTVEGQDSSGAYMVLRSDADATLVGASTDVSRSATLHEMMMHGSMMMMHGIEKIALPAGKDVVLDDQNLHLMLEDLKHALKVGDTVHLVLRVADASGKVGEVKVDAVVRPLSTHDAHAGHEDHGAMHGDHSEHDDHASHH